VKGLFVTATGTDVGKTFVSCGIARFLKNCVADPGVMKPVASGGKWVKFEGKKTLVSEDALRLIDASDAGDPVGLVNPVCLKIPLAPYPGSLIERARFSIARVMNAYRQVSKRHGFMVVEGIGGVRVPLLRNVEVSDLILKMGLPAIVVSSAKLGALNHTLLTLEHLKRKKVRVLGIVLNFFNSKEIADRTNLLYFKEKKIPVLATLPESKNPAGNFDFAAQEIEKSFLGKWLKQKAF
jgi:dethiobiotin synthetase